MGYMYNKGPYFIGSEICAIIFLIGFKKKKKKKKGTIIFMKARATDFSCEKTKRKQIVLI